MRESIVTPQVSARDRRRGVSPRGTSAARTIGVWVSLFLGAVALTFVWGLLASSSGPAPSPSTDAPSARNAQIQVAMESFESVVDSVLSQSPTAEAFEVAPALGLPDSTGEVTDSSLASTKRWTSDVIRSLAFTPLGVRVSHLIRSVQLNPLDRQLGAQARADLERVLTYHQQRIQQVRQAIAHVRHQELLALADAGRLPTAESAASPELKQKARELAGRDVRLGERMRATGKNWQETSLEKAYSERLLQLLIQDTPYKSVVKRSDGSPTLIAKREWCSASLAIESQGHLAVLTSEMAYFVIDWFGRSGCLPSGEEERLIALLVRHLEAKWGG